MKSRLPFLLQLPLILLMIASFLGSIYAAIKKISGIGYATPIIIGIFIALYFYGRHLEEKRRKDYFF